jgi:uncharacterized membrane protein
VTLTLMVVVLAGAWLRLDGLGDRTIGHIEAYVPNLPLPPEVSEPPYRDTLWQTLRGSMGEVHPPAWYLGMWFWTEVFGTSPVAIRLPQALLGVVSILLVFFVVRKEAGEITALMAAVLLAFNGHHVLWSQTARPQALACALGLGSTLFLLNAHQSANARRLAAYAVVTLFGLATIYYFWVFVAAQLCWILADGFVGKRANVNVLRVQVATVILASPLASLAVYQSRPSYLGESLGQFLTDYVAFAFIFEPDQDLNPFPSALRALLAGGAAVCLALGAFALRGRRGPVVVPAACALVPLRLVLASCSLAVVAVGAATVVTRHLEPDRAMAVLATAVLPAAGLLALVASERVFRERSEVGAPPALTRPGILPILVLVPAILIALINAKVPFLASRHMLICTPYLLGVLAGGIVWLHRTTPAAWRPPLGVFLGVCLALVSVAGISYQAQRPQSPQDYSGLAVKWLPAIGPRDVILARRDYVLTPLYYYLQSHWEKLVPPSHYQRALAADPGAAVWVVTFAGQGMPGAAGKALVEYEEVGAIEARRITARRFLRADQLGNRARAAE